MSDLVAICPKCGQISFQGVEKCVVCLEENELWAIQGRDIRKVSSLRGYLGKIEPEVLELGTLRDKIEEKIDAQAPETEV